MPAPKPVVDQTRRRPDRVRVGECEVVVSLGTIRRGDGEVTRLEPKVMAVLVRLLERPGLLVTREELLEDVWEGRYVTEHVLSRSIFLLRRALGDDARAPRYIETLPARGYRMRFSAAPASGSVPAAVEPGRRRWQGVAGSLGLAAALAVVTAWERQPVRRASVPRPVAVELGSEVDPALSPDGSTLAFSWTRDDTATTDLYLSRLDGDRPERLTRAAGRETNPAWHPGGRHLAFSRTGGGGQGIYSLSLSDGRERWLAATTAGDLPDLAWAPDGRYLYYTDRRRPSAASAVVRLDPMTGSREWITTPPAGSFGDRDLALSPAGDRIAFARAVLPGVEDLYVRHLAAGTVRRLTWDGASINGIAWVGSDELLFSSSRDGSGRLWRVPSTGGRAVVTEGASDGAFDPSYAAGATRLVYERRTFDTDVWVLPIRSDRGGLPSRLAPSTRWDASPAVAAGGEVIAFVSSRSGTAELWLGSPGAWGSLRRRHLAFAARGRPAWSPDSWRVAVAVVRRGQLDVEVLDAATGGALFGIRSGADEACPLFLPDGNLLFTSNERGGWGVWSARGDRGSKRLVLSDAFCPRLAPDGEGLYFSRPERPGLWQWRFAGGAVAPVPGTEHVLPWDDWDSGRGTLVVRPVGRGSGAGAFVLSLGAGGGAASRALPIEPASFPGLGLSVAPDGSFVAFGAAAHEDSDLLLVDRFR